MSSQLSKEIEWNYIPEKDLSYLKQPKEAHQITHSDHYKYHSDAKNHYRRIFYGVEYTEFEKKCMKELDEAIKKEEITLPHDWDDAQTLKYCYSGGFELKQSLECLKMHLNWKNDPKMQRLNSQAEQILKEGVFYHLGRDLQFRPIIVLNIWKVNPKNTPVDVYLSAICNLLVKVAEVEFIRGHVESWMVILETNQKGITDLEISTILKIVQIMAKNFTSTLEKMFIVNPSFLFNGLWSILKKFIHPETAAKIHMLNKKEFPIMQKFIASDQLENKYGGTIPNQTIYWPPINTLKTREISTHNNNEDEFEIQDEGEYEYENQEQFTSYISFKTINNNSQVFFEKENLGNGKQSTAYSRTDNYQEDLAISKPIIFGQGNTSNDGGCCSRCNIY